MNISNTDQGDRFCICNAYDIHISQTEDYTIMCDSHLTKKQMTPLPVCMLHVLNLSSNADVLSVLHDASGWLCFFSSEKMTKNTNAKFYR